MAHYIHLSPAEGEDDSLVQIAHFFVQLLKEDAKEAEAFEQQFEASYGDKTVDFCKILGLFFQHIDLLFCDDKVKEAEGCFSTLISLLQFLDSEESMMEMTKKMIDVLVRSTSFANLRLKLLMSMYSFVRPTFPGRFSIFWAILNFSYKVKLFDQLLPYLDHIDEWKGDWNCTIEEERQLYVEVHKYLRALGWSQLAYSFLRKYLKLYDDASPAELASEECSSSALLVVLDAISLPKVYTVDDVLSLKAVQALKTKHEKLLRIMQIFQDGSDTQEIEDFRRGNSKVFEQYNIDYPTLLGKMRILAVASIAKDTETLSLVDAAQKLGRSVQEVEEWTVKAISDGVLEGRIDQLNKVVLVKSTLVRKFGPPEWDAVKEKLKLWEASFSIMQSAA